MAILQPTFAKKQKYMPKCSMFKCIRNIYPGRIDMIIYQLYQLVGGFPAKFVSSHISQNIFFHMIGNKSFHFIFLRGGGAFPKLVYTFNYFSVRQAHITLPFLDQ